MNPFGIAWKPGDVTLTSPPSIPLDAPTAVLFVAVAVAVALLTRRRPALGVAALVCLVPFALARYVGPTTVTLEKVGLIGFLAGLVAARRRLVLAAGEAPRWIGAALAFELIATVLSGVEAQHRGAVLRELAKIGEYGLIFGAVVLARASDDDDAPFWRALSATAAVVCIAALAQYLVGAHSGIALGGRPFPRIAGPLEGPNQLSGYLEIVVPLLLARTLTAHDRPALAVATLAVVVDVLTFSRLGFACAIVAVVVTASAVRLRPGVSLRIAVTMLALGVIVFAAALRAGVPARYFSIDPTPYAQTHLANRALLWHAAIELWHHSPLVGIGAGNFEYELGAAGLPGVRTHANSLFLQSLAETGAIGVAATIATFALAIAALLRARRRDALVAGMLGATTALALHQLGDDLFFFPKVGAMFWLALGLAAAAGVSRSVPRKTATAPEGALRT